MAPRVGDMVKQRYRLLRLIGDGGMGSVYEARHELLGTSVALKFLHPHLMRRPGLKERFLQEAQLSARINSPHVVRASDVDETENGLAFFVMEYVPGATLESLFRHVEREGRWLTREEAFDYFLQILEGVEAAHALGIVHRDLKPENVLVASDEGGHVLLKILDFGVAKLKAADAADRGLTAPDSVMGTPEYMAPEQAYSPMNVDRRADIFAVGVMLYEMLSSRRPVEGGTLMSMADAYYKGNITPLTQVAQVDERLAAAVHRAIAPRPEQRFESAAAFRDAILPCTPASLHAPPIPKAFAVTIDDPATPWSLPVVSAHAQTAPQSAAPETAVLPPVVSKRVGEGTMIDGQPAWAKTGQTLPSTLRNTGPQSTAPLSNVPLSNVPLSNAPESTLKSEPPAVVQTMRSETPPPMPASVPPPRTVWSEPPPAMWGPPSSHPPPMVQHAITVDGRPRKRHTPVALVLVVAVFLATVLAALAYAWSAGLFR